MNHTLMFVSLFSGIWAFIGVVFFIIGAAMLYHKKKKERNCTSKAYGRVIDIVGRRSHDREGGYSLNWYPVFEYNIGSLKFIKEYAYGSSRPKYAIGQTVEVYYNPEDYNEYYVGRDPLPNTIAKIFTAVGVGAITVAVVSAIIILRFGL